MKRLAPAGLIVIMAAWILPVCSVFAATIHVPGDQPTIQAGIDAAQDEDIVLVAPGTYVENIDFLGKSITLLSQVGPDGTVIDGNRDGTVVTFASGETASSVIEGFTIRNSDGYEGGGIYCGDSSPKITNCSIKNNIAYYGGGIYTLSSYPIITNCTISENIAQFGGGIHHSEWYWSRTCYDDGKYPLLTIAHCTITENLAVDGGGVKCTTMANMAIINCVLWNDFAVWEGPEIYVGNDHNPSTLTVSYSDVQGGQYAVVLAGGCMLDWGPGNIDEDPLFVGGDDYHLAAGSPCIDAGVDAGVIEDMDGDMRPYGAGFDMGADEYALPGPCFVGVIMQEANYSRATMR